MRGRIIKFDRKEFFCKLDDGREVMALAKGNLHKDREGLVVGDYVTIEEVDGESFITEKEKRKNSIFRLIVREQRKRHTAANVDVLAIVTSVSRPEFKRGLIDRFLVRAVQWEIAPIIIFNKMDQYDTDDFDIEYERDRLLPLGVKCFELSAKQGDEYSSQYLDNGLAELRVVLEDKTTIFLGQSGVGKSTVIDLISGGKANLRTKEVGKGGKGTHTTTWSEIIDCGSFQLVDSPGIRSLSLEDMTSEDFIEYFPDVAQKATECKFKNCAHTLGTKGCAFWSEKESQELEFLQTRLESYLRMLEEIGQIPDWKKRP